MYSYKLMISPRLDPLDNMMLDSFLTFETDMNIIRIYTWEQPTITLGAGSKSIYLDKEAMLEKNIACVRRETGGGILNHFDDLCFSFIQTNFQKPKEQYGFVKLLIQKFLSDNGVSVDMQQKNNARSVYCNNEINTHEISSKGKKIVAIAQRYLKQRSLTHGSISLINQINILINVLKIKVNSELIGYVDEHQAKIDIDILGSYLQKSLKIDEIIGYEKILNSKEYKRYKINNIERFIA